MITDTQVSLECKICGGAWTATGYSFYPPPDSPYKGPLFNIVVPRECLECGETGMWDIAKPSEAGLE